MMRARRLPQLVKVLILVDVGLLLAALGVWLVLRGPDEAENAANPGLRGSRPPAGQTMPDLSGIAGIRPPVPSPARLRGGSVQIAATCMACRSGDIFGGYLGRLRSADIPEASTLLVLAWGGDVETWRREWDLGTREDAPALAIHVAVTPAAAIEVQRRMGVTARVGGETSGISYLYDADGRWRSTWFIGQLDREDIRHDLEELARD